ncbi:MAG: sigma-54-dependent Fis family transcriptional regulator [Planctomycetota bacterium]
MASSIQSERIHLSATGSQLLVDLVTISMTAESEQDFRQKALELVNRLAKTNGSVLIRGIKGQWRVLSHAGEGEGLPTEMLAEALDSERCEVGEGWIAAPLEKPNVSGRLLACSTESLSKEDFDAWAAAFCMALDVFQARQIQQRRAERLSAILDMSVHWNQSKGTDQLLEQIAQESTRLLGAERATIFLPDAGGSELVGKPATGVESGEIRIPANAGVVGQVVQSSQPARVDDDVSSEQQQIHRDVDEQLGFQTRTILCVPMFNSSGKTIGAFELINRLQGNFTDEDEYALTELAAHAAVAIENTQQLEELVSSKRTVAKQAADQVQMIGQCEAIEKLKATIQKVANTELVVLITGENGTGKEVVAQMIHYLSDRSDEILVAVNCAAIAENLLESELFGHEKGAFTDAHQTREGKFELASKGTLFLDEIGDMSLDGQSKLLRVLEEKKVVRVGGSTPIPTDARVVAATNQDLSGLISEKKFRQDLYFRLNVVPIELPPLRERGDDIILLSEHFLSEFCRKARRNVPNISASAKKRLLGHSWPGNIRELRNMMERLAYLTDGDKIDATDLDFVNSPATGSDSAIPMDLPLAEATRQFQVDYIKRHIDRARGNMTDAAAKMGLHRSNLYRKMKQLGMSGSDDDSDSDLT